MAEEFLEVIKLIYDVSAAEAAATRLDQVLSIVQSRLGGIGTAAQQGGSALAAGLSSAQAPLEQLDSKLGQTAAVINATAAAMAALGTSSQAAAAQMSVAFDSSGMANIKEIYRGVAGMVPPTGGPADARGILRTVTQQGFVPTQLVEDGKDQIGELNTIVTQYENDIAILRTVTRQAGTMQTIGGDAGRDLALEAFANGTEVPKKFVPSQNNPIRVMTEDLTTNLASQAASRQAEVAMTRLGIENKAKLDALESTAIAEQQAARIAQNNALGGVGAQVQDQTAAAQKQIELDNWFRQAQRKNAMVTQNRNLGEWGADTQEQVNLAVEQEKAIQQARANYRMSDPGTQFPASRRLYLQQQLGDAKTAMDAANAALQEPGGQTPANIANVEKLSGAYKGLQTELAGTESGVGKLSNQFMRHIGWIAQTMIVMFALREAYKFIQEVTKDVTDLADATARLSFVSGQTPQAASAFLLGRETQLAQYGVNPQQAGRGEVLMSQMKLPPGSDITAGKLALAMGDAREYDVIMKEVGQTINRSNGAFDDQTKLLDLVALLYQNANLSATEYFNVIQDAIPLSQLMGKSLDVVSVGLARSTQDLGESADLTAGIFSRMIIKLNQPVVQQELKYAFSIEGKTPAELFTKVVDMSQKLSGNDLNKLLTTLGSGGLLPGTLLRVPQALRDMSDAMQMNIDKTGKFGEMFDGVFNTVGTQLTLLTTNAQAFINAWANTGGIKIFFDVLAAGLTSFNMLIANSSKENLGGEAIAKLPADQQKAIKQKYQQEAGLTGVEAIGMDIFNKVSPLLEGAGAIGGPWLKGIVYELVKSKLEEIPGTREWINLHYQNDQPPPGTTVSTRGGHGGIPGLTGGAGGLPPEPMPVGNTLFAPSGVSQDALQKRSDEIAAEFDKVRKATGDTVVPAIEKFGVMNEATNTFAYTIQGTAESTSAALRELSASAKDTSLTFGGIRDLPTNRQGDQWGRFQQEVFASQAFLQGQANVNNIPYDPQEQIFMVFDPLTNAMRPIVGTMDAFNMAVKKATDTVVPFGGFQNLPKGVSVDQLQAQADIWQARVVNAQPGVQSYEQMQTFMVWDDTKKSFQAIVTSNEALQKATEDLTKVNQVTGTFNVPAGEQVWVPFTALQQHFVPADSLTTAGTSLSTSAAQLSSAAMALNTAASAIAQTGFRTPPYSSMPSSAQTVAGMPPSQAYWTTPPYSSYTSPPPSGSPSKIASPTPTQQQNTNLTLYTTNQINLDGQQIANSMNTEYYPQLSTLGRGSQMSMVAV